MKAWDPNVNFKKEDVKKVPIWVQIEDLDLKYWGQRSLFKIVGQVGEPIMVDSVTRERERLNYPRILIEVRIDQNFPDMLEFENEYGNNTHVGIKYEWKPIACNNCFGLGHSTIDCKKSAKVEKKWILKEYHRPKPVVDEDGFLQVSRGSKGQVQPTKSAVLRMENTLQALNSDLEQQEEAEMEIVNEEEEGNTGGGKIPLSSMDKLLCWNVRGANNQQKQRLIKQFISLQKVDFVGLLETRVKARKLGVLYSNIFDGWCFSSNIAWHKGGKIVIAWNPSRFIVDIIRCTSQFMHLKISTVDGMFDSFVTVVYASNSRMERKKLWEDICGLNTCEKWCLMGDFNEILAKEERVGLRVSSWPDGDFLQCVACCNLEDIKSSGNFFTWTNKQHGGDRIFSKIDRVLANQEWLNKYETAEVVFLNEGLFDHCPAIISLYPVVASGLKPFKYFRMWKAHSKFESCLVDIWSKQLSGSKMFQVVTKLRSLKVALKDINREGFSNLQGTCSCG
ncbi:uncharacterized protein LOC133034505 [Cannabis sativa]|uniref:uncharacterized protein LOC133034505 n=1 Tax=Cannabis sativa TaxID=3483 RepID=UPI0029CA374E|nr:uncharacterized protein LOC133034505 [Cannabis sativa]